MMALSVNFKASMPPSPFMSCSWQDREWEWVGLGAYVSWWNIFTHSCMLGNHNLRTAILGASLSLGGDNPGWRNFRNEVAITHLHRAPHLCGLAHSLATSLLSGVLDAPECPLQGKARVCRKPSTLP